MGKKSDPELEAILRLSDADIDTSDVPEVTDWKDAVVGKFYRPIKEPVTLRLDVDIIAWLKSGGPGYQTRINALLRAAMLQPTMGPSAREGMRGGGQHERVSQGFCFPRLEERMELERSCLIAERIQTLGSIFAPAA